MSALSFLTGYGSNSEDSDCEQDRINNHQEKCKLPVPDLSAVSSVLTHVHVDNPKLHGGRTRSFPHVRGNWATFVYLQYPANDAFNHLLNKLEGVVNAIVKSERCEDLHVSLSRTVVLKYHLINPFTTSLQEVLKKADSFELGFDSVKIYCNEENTRTFIALQVDYFSHSSVLKLTNKVDQVLEEFKLPLFYESPSFHMSILWVNGNHKESLQKVVENLNELVIHDSEKSLKATIIDKVYCKSGNKLYQYFLGQDGWT